MEIQREVTPTKLIRVAVYIDGFNLYHGMKEARYERFLWLNVYRLAEHLTQPGHGLVLVKYFTSRISGPPDAVRRQNTYLDAIDTTATEIIPGKFQNSPIKCGRCKDRWLIPEEKMTDVNIATQMLSDAFLNHFDKAILISGDSDLVPPVKLILDRFPAKRVIVAFPPYRHSADLQAAATSTLRLNQPEFKACQFADKIEKENGHILERPATWN